MNKVKMISADMVEYRGYLGSLNYDQANNLYFGQVIADGTQRIEYSGKTIYDFTQAFADGIDNYLLQF